MSVTSGRPGETGRTPLDRQRVFAAALALVDRDGLAGLSMRRLAADLGVEAMALYRHAAGKEELLDGVVDALYAEIHPGHDNPGDWRSGLRGFAIGFRRVVLAHPRTFPLVVARMLATPMTRRLPEALRVVEELFELLSRAGFDPGGVAAAQRRLMGYVVGELVVELREVVDDPDEPEPALRLGLYRLPAHTYPRLRALAATLADYDAESEFNDGLDGVLDEIGRRFAPSGPPNLGWRRGAETG